MKRRGVIPPALAASLLAAVAGCGGSPNDVESQDFEVKVCGTSTPLHGIDVSYHDGPIDWAAVKGDGQSFAFIRVSDGTFSDPQFSTNWAGAQAAGLIRGAYHFFRPSHDPYADADQFLQEMGTLGPGDLPPTLDMEVKGGETNKTVVHRALTWLKYVEAATGRRPMIYTSPSFWRSIGNPDLSAYGAWIANWGPKCPTVPSPWSDWRFWQTSDSGNVAGISNAVDLDLFNGTLADLQALAGM
jgi:lysozyme